MIAFLGFGIVSAIGNQKNNDGKERAKARYFYLKGAVSEAKGNADEAYEFYKKAHKSDPTFSDAAFAFGYNRMGLYEDTFASQVELLRDLAYMRSHIDNYPLDVESGERYAYAAALADTISEALRAYRKLVEKNPGLSRLYIPLAYYHINSGNADSAVYAIREYERLEEAGSETTLKKASYWLSSGDTLSALAEVASYVESNSGKPEPLLDQAVLYQHLGKKDSVLYNLEKALKLFPERSDLKLDIALLYEENGDTARFHQLVEEAFKGDDLDYEERMKILDIYSDDLVFSVSGFVESDRLFEYAATLYPEDADFYHHYARYEVSKNDFEAALEREKKALEFNPTEPSFLTSLLSYSIVAGKPREGMKEFETFPNKEGRRQYGILLAYVTAAQMSNDYEKALQWADTILSLETPGLSLETVLQEGMHDSMEEKFGPSGIFRASVVYEVAGDMYAKQGKRDDAVRSYENSIILMPDNNPSAYNNYAYYIVETLKAQPGTPQMEKAKEMSRKSLEQSGEYPQGTYLDTYAWILFHEGNYKDAQEYMEMALEEEGADVAAEMLSHYGDILFMNGKEEEAVEQWEKALKLEPEDTLLKKKVEHKTYYAE